MRSQPAKHLFDHKQNDYDHVGIEFLSGTITQASDSQLLSYLSALGSNATGDDAVQSRDQIQAMAINHILMQRYIGDIDKRAGRTTRFVIFLASLSLIASVVQIYLAIAMSS